jgi:histidinol phosphatase-like enzyme (inositol monophosphatase family)
VSPRDLERAARLAEAAADAARREILPRFRRVEVERKRDGSPVTEADRAAERAIRAVLREFDPAVGVLGEEYGDERGGASRWWVVDPIDGTIAFSRGIPLYGTLVALVEDGEAVLGLIDLPSLGERIVGWRGGGVRRAGAPLRVSREGDPLRAIVCHGDAFAFDRFGARPALARLAAELPIFRGYTDAFGHALVIQGSVDAMVDVGLNPWDVAATQCLVIEAGGRCVTIDRTAEDRGIGLLFGSPPLVEWLEDVLAAGVPRGAERG